MIELIDSPKLYTLKVLDETIGCWRFKDNVSDISGNSQDLTKTSGTYTTGTTEPNNTSLQVGTAVISATRSASSATAFDLGTHSFSMEMWIKITASGHVFFKGDGATGWLFGAISGGTFRMYLGSQQLNTTKSYSYNKWHYVAISVDSGNEAKIYVNGRLDNTLGSLSTFTNNVSKDLSIGHTGLGFGGFLDEIAVHSGKILTLADVQDRYAGRKDIRTFYTDVNNIPVYYHKYTTPVSKLEFANTVYNVLSNGIRAEWSVKDGTYSTAYTGKVSNIKFDYGYSYPETLVGYATTPQWKVVAYPTKVSG